MALTPAQTLLTVLAVMAGTLITRFLPFALFPESREVPDYIGFLGRVLPPAMMGLLVVYCFKGVTLTAFPFGIPEVVSTLLIVGLQLRRKNVLLSIGGGTLVYMLLVQVVFV